MTYCNSNMELTRKEKDKMIEGASKKYKEFMEALQIDMIDDPNSKDTPTRVAKMYVNELFKGRYDAKPDIKSFPNTEKYDQILFTNCEATSICAHHHVPIQNKVFIGILTNPDESSRLIGLSKYTRIVEWIANRPTIQEDMTQQIHKTINDLCEGNLGVMVYVIGQHGCTLYRGVKQLSTKMITSSISGIFQSDQGSKLEFMNMVNNILGEQK